MCNDLPVQNDDNTDQHDVKDSLGNVVGSIAFNFQRKHGECKQHAEGCKAFKPCEILGPNMQGTYAGPAGGNIKVVVSAKRGSREDVTWGSASPGNGLVKSIDMPDADPNNELLYKLRCGEDADDYTLEMTVTYTGPNGPTEVKYPYKFHCLTCED